MDIKTFFNQETSSFGITIANGDLVADQGLQTAVVVSLFTDRRAEPDDAIPDGSNDRRGWWGDTYAAIPGDQIGSRLWLLGRAKETQDTLNRAREYALEALQWLVDDGLVKSVDVTAEHLRRGVFALHIIITLLSDDPWQTTFDYRLLEAA